MIVSLFSQAALVFPVSSSLPLSNESYFRWGNGLAVSFSSCSIIPPSKWWRAWSPCRQPPPHSSRFLLIQIYCFRRIEMLNGRGCECSAESICMVAALCSRCWLLLCAALCPSEPCDPCESERRDVWPYSWMNYSYSSVRKLLTMISC